MTETKLKKEQQDIINFNEGNIIVSASAGSGKTFVMIERAVRLIVEKKAHVSEILAVTFTEAAAKDMKDKLKKALTDKISENPDEELINELKNIDTADISTIHSFASRLIRNYFFIAGVSPDFSVIDDAISGRLKLDSINKVLRELYAKKEKWFYKLVKIYSDRRNDDGLKKIIYSLYDFIQVEAYPENFYAQLLNAYTDNGFNDMLSKYKALLDGEFNFLKERAEESLKVFSDENNESGKKFAEIVITYLTNLISAKSIYDLKSFDGIADQCRMSVSTDLQKNAKETIGEIKGEINKILLRVKPTLTDYETDKSKLPFFYEHVKGLLDIAAAFSAEYEKEKREENVLDFPDLEHFALKILSDEESLSAIKGKYKYIFADEYQDVNGVQEEILSKISSCNMFMVGDVKQSIYGFRGCRPDFFVNKISNMQKNGGYAEELNYNFRSAKNIINAVNEIFSFSMQEELFGVDYENKAQLKDGGIYPENKDGRFELHFLKREQGKKSVETPRIYDILEETAKVDDSENSTSLMVAKIISDELGKTYYDIKSKEEKIISFKDIAVLTRAKDSGFVSKIVHGLKNRGIPVTSAVSENVCEFPEVKGLISALKLIDEFNDEIALAVTMLGPIGKFNEQDLVDIVSENKNVGFCSAVMNYRKDNEGVLKEKLTTFFDYYNSLRLFSDFNSAREVLNKILQDTGYEYYFLAADDGEERVKRIRRFVSASYDKNREYSVKEFLSLIECAPKRFEFYKNGEEETVRVVTEHSSKGLEFPVVILCGLEKTLKSRNELNTFILNRPYIGVSYYDFDNLIRTDNPYLGFLKEKRNQERINDELRLFYVGTTRAKYSLHVVFNKAKDERKSTFITAENFIDYLPKTMPVTVHNLEELEFLDMAEKSGEVLVQKADAKRVEELKKKFSFKYPYTSEVALPLKTSVTGAISVEKEALKYMFSYGDTDKEKGTALHKILELCDFKDLTNLEKQAENLISLGVIDEKDIKGVDFSKIKSTLLRAGFDKFNGKLYKEQSFVVSVEADKVLDTKSSEQVLVQGVIDLLHIDGDSAEIYDYKYSALEKESLKLKYRKQLYLYSYAVEKILKLKVKKKTLINIATGEVVELT